jgi:hypothetical protein
MSLTERKEPKTLEPYETAGKNRKSEIEMGLRTSSFF